MNAKLRVSNNLFRKCCAVNMNSLLNCNLKIILLLTCFHAFSCVTIDFTGDIIFLLYTKNLGKYPQVLFLGDNATLQLSDFKSSRKTVILIHEWGTGQRSIHTTPIKNAYSKLQNVNIITVDWHNEAMLSYPSARKLVDSIGEYISTFLQFLITDGHAKASDFHIFGYGLGAHIAGNAGRSLKTINKITALNPQIKLFSIKDSDTLKQNDAKCVHVFYSPEKIHSKNVIYGMGRAVIYILKNETINREFNLGQYYAQFILSYPKIKAFHCDNLKNCLNGTFPNIDSTGVDILENRECIEGYYYISA